MTQNFIRSQSLQPQLYVFRILFNGLKNDNISEIVERLAQDYEKLQEESWYKYWDSQGEQIIVETWNLKYKEYILDETRCTENKSSKEEDSERTDENQITLENNDSNTVNEIASDTELWRKLWQQHAEETYVEQYFLYASIFYNYYLDLRKLSEVHPPETTDLTKEAILTDESPREELSQLKLLGLPTAFGRRGQTNCKKHKENTKQKCPQSQHFSDFFSDSEIETDKEDSITSNHEMANESEGEESVADDALHVLQSKTIVKRRKNRKLRNVPTFMLEEKSLLKYWRMRFSLFSRFDEGIRLDRESWFSVTPEKVAAHLAQRLSCDVIVDGFCGSGGNAIQFAKTCHKVIAIDIDPSKVEMAKHNATIYGVADKIDFIVGDFLQLSTSGHIKADTVFLSPPWGGPKYKHKRDYDIERFLLPVGALELMEYSRNICENIALFLPRNSNIQQIVKLAGVGNRCEIEHNYLDSRLVAITALYGEKIISPKP